MRDCFALHYNSLQSLTRPQRLSFTQTCLVFLRAFVAKTFLFNIATADCYDCNFCSRTSGTLATFLAS